MNDGKAVAASRRPTECQRGSACLEVSAASARLMRAKMAETAAAAEEKEGGFPGTSSLLPHLIQSYDMRNSSSRTGI